VGALFDAPICSLGLSCKPCGGAVWFVELYCSVPTPFLVFIAMQVPGLGYPAHCPSVAAPRHGCSPGPWPFVRAVLFDLGGGRGWVQSVNTSLGGTLLRSVTCAFDEALRF
jgi:hypothetical protein